MLSAILAILGSSTVGSLIGGIFAFLYCAPKTGAAL